MTDKEHFKKFSKKHQAVLPYSLTYDWWAKVVKKSWDVALVLKDKEAVAVWPYFIRKKGPWQVISPAYFTPFAGPFIIYPKGQKQANRSSYEHKMHQELLEQLPRVAEVEQKFYLGFNNGLAFQWNGFNEYLSYTYVLDLHPNEKKLWSNLRENIRRQIRKAKNNIQITNIAKEEATVEKLFKATFKAKKEDYPIGDTGIIERMLTYIQEAKKGSIIYGEENGEIHTVNVCVYDEQTAYYLLGGSDEKYRNSAAASWLMWEQILKAKEKGLTYFNFEGSSIPSVEQFLRGFGGELKKVHRIHKIYSKSLELVNKAKRH